MAAEYGRDRMGSVLTPQDHFRGHVPGGTPVWGAQDEPADEMGVDVGPGVAPEEPARPKKRGRSASISEDERAREMGRHQRTEEQDMPASQRVEYEMPEQIPPERAHPSTGVTDPREICRVLRGMLRNFGGNLGDSNLRGRVGDMLRQLGMKTGTQSLTDFGNQVSTGKVSSELFSRIQDKVDEICNAYATGKQHAGTLKYKKTAGVEEFTTPTAPRFMQRIGTPTPRQKTSPGIQAPLEPRPKPAKPRSPARGTTPEPVRPKWATILTPHKPPKFKNTEIEKGWSTYKARISEVGKYHERDLLDNPETYAEYKAVLNSANTLAKRHKFEPVIPKFVKAEDKQNVQDKLKEMLDVIISEQRSVEQDIFDKETEKEKKETMLKQHQTRRARIGGKVRELQSKERNAERRETPRIRRELDAKQREGQRVTDRIHKFENQITAFQREIEALGKDNKDLQHRKPNVLKALKALQRAKPGLDLSGTYSDIQREHDRPGSAPRHLKTPEPKLSAARLRKVAQAGTAASGKKVDSLRRKLLLSTQKHDRARGTLLNFEKIKDSPQKENSRNNLEGLLERLSHRYELQRTDFDGLIGNISRLLPNLRLEKTRSRKIELDNDDRYNLEQILGQMRTELKKSQLIKILQILQISTPKLHSQYRDLVKGHDQAASTKRSHSRALEDALRMHKHAEGFHSGKGMILKLLKPSKPKKARKPRKKKAKKQEVQKELAEPIGPFRF